MAVPGVLLGAAVSSRAPGGLIRAALTVVLTASGLKLLGANTVAVAGPDHAFVFERTAAGWIETQLARPAQSEDFAEPRPDGQRRVGVARDRRPGAVQLLGTAVVRKRLQWVESEASLMRIERLEWGAAARMGDPGPGLDAGGDFGDRAIWYA